MNSRQGVTLLEVLMVIMIITAALAAAPRLSGSFLQTTAMNADVDAVAETLRLARETSIASGSYVIVRRAELMHPVRGLVWPAIEIIAKPGPYSKGDVTYGGNSNNGRSWMTDPIWLSSDIKIDGDSDEIVFDPRGTADRDAVWVLYGDYEKRPISVKALDGSISTP